MLEFMKIVGLSAVLSTGFVTASEMQAHPDREPASGKIYTDRVPQGEPAAVRFTKAAYASAPQAEDQGAQTAPDGKGDALGKTPAACASQAWPHIAPECLGTDGGAARGSIRVVTIEQREGVNTSVLVRVPAAELVRH